MKNVVAMILAGGRGKRMDILCNERPKPVLPFAGGLRVIDFSLSNCLHSGISDIAVLVDYQRQQLADYLKGWRSANYGTVDILEPESGSYKGTADAVYRNLDYLRRYSPEAILVLAGDHIYRMDYRKMLDSHHRSGADVTVGVISVPLEQTSRFGIVATDSESRITDFVEKPQSPIGNLASMGIYVFSGPALIEHLVRDAAQADLPHDFGYAVIPRMVKEKKVFAHKFDGYWQDIGTIGAYYEANMELLSEMPCLGINGKWPIFTRDNALVPVVSSHEGDVQRSLVSEGCVVMGKVENSILSPGVRVGREAVVRNSIIMPNVVIGEHSVIERCIVDEGVNIGRFCYIGFRGKPGTGDRDITVVGKDASVPAGTAIGRSCKVLPGVKPSDFSANVVLAGSVVSPC